ncbi:MAG: hypothetical protein CMI16_06635 [Opitutaceae bacterium]|nr:hypothetical protein [Opitutaceae bacterium]
MPLDLPHNLADGRFNTIFDEFRKKLDERVSENTAWFEPNRTRRITYASTSNAAATSSNDSKNVALRDCVAEVYRSVIGEVPRDVTYSATFTFEPAIDVVRAEYEPIAVLVCSEPGLQIMTKDGWCDVAVENSKSGVVLAGALHPIFPSTRYRFRNPVKACVLFTVDAACANELTRAYYHRDRMSKDIRY